MHRALVTLLALAMIATPLSPSALAQSGETYAGDHLEVDVDPDLPGLRNLTIVASGERVISAIVLPGEDVDVSTGDDEVRVRTDSAEVRLQDAPSLPGELGADQGLSIMLHVADGVEISSDLTEEGPQVTLSPPTGPNLTLAADHVSQSNRTLTVTGDAETRLDTGEEDGTEDQDQAPGDPSSRPSNESPTGDGDPQGSADASNRSDGDRNASRSDGAGDPRTDDRRDRHRTSAEEGDYRVGSVRFELAPHGLRNLTVRDQPMLESLGLPNLLPATAERRANELRIEGEDASLRIQADGGLLIRTESDGPLTARLAEDVETRVVEDHAFLRVGKLLLVAQGDELEIDDGRLTAENELRLAGRTAAGAPESPVWRPADRLSAAAQPELPREIEGRFVSFTLNATGIENLTLHGTPLGSIGFDPIRVDEIDRRGARLSVEGPTFELDATDTPATRLSIEATNLTVDLPLSATLPSGAHVDVTVEGDELTLHVTRPADALAGETPVEHRPADAPVEPTDGPTPGLRSQAAGGELGVTSQRPDTVATTFSGELNGTAGNVSLRMDLVRAMLIDDTNGNGQVDIGEPAIAEHGLSNGTSRVEGDTLVNRFDLWNGNLSVSVEPGNGTAKVTYTVTNLSAPPGTLFVLETEIGAPPGASLAPTADGVVVHNGSMEARYTLGGPVTVDGSQAWADRSIFVDSNGTVSVLLAYPAGDDIVHDPTVSIASVPGAQTVAQLAASPYAIAAGAIGAVLLVGATAWARRRGRPGP